jgi:hypothetical protein
MAVGAAAARQSQRAAAHRLSHALGRRHSGSSTQPHHQLLASCQAAALSARITATRAASIGPVTPSTPASPPARQQLQHSMQEKITLTQEEQALFDTLLAAASFAGSGTVLRAAGGWVRDKLLGKASADIDIALDNMLGRDFADKVGWWLGLVAGARGQGQAADVGGTLQQNTAITLDVCIVSVLLGVQQPALSKQNWCCKPASTTSTQHTQHTHPPVLRHSAGERVPGVSGQGDALCRGHPLQPGAVKASGDGAHESQRTVDRPGQPEVGQSWLVGRGRLDWSCPCAGRHHCLDLSPLRPPNAPPPPPPCQV